MLLLTKRTQFTPPPPGPRPKMRNEPNLSPGHGHSEPGYPDSAKRTQSAGVRICGTNPIYTAPDLWKTKNAKRTQFTVPLASRRLPHTRHLCETNPIYHPPTGTASRDTPIMRNEANSIIPSVPPPPISAKRTQSPPGKNAKRTQSQPPRASCLLPRASFLRNEPNLPHHRQAHDKLCETNPIPAAGQPPNMRNEPNFTPTVTLPCAKNAKRTQS